VESEPWRNAWRRLLLLLLLLLIHDMVSLC
jgi:hypothetical protein